MKPKEKPHDDQNIDDQNNKHHKDLISIDEQIDQLADIIIDIFLNEQNEEK